MAMAVASTVPRTALIFADQPGDGPSAAGPRAFETIEHQARVLILAGCTHVVVLADVLGERIEAAIARLKRQVRLSVATNPDEAAAAISGGESVIMLARNVVPVRLPLAGDGTGPVVPLVATLDSRTLPPGDWERIDAVAHWAGVAVLDGMEVKATAAHIGEWDLQSTLLRRAVQAGAARDAYQPDEVIDLTDGSAAAAIEHGLVRAAAGETGALPWRRQVARTAPLLIDRAVASGRPGLLIWGSAAALLGISVTLAALSWTVSALAIAPLAMLAADIGWLREASARGRPPPRRWWRRLRWAVAAAPVAATGWVEPGWGHGALAAAWLAAMVTLDRQRAIAAARPRTPAVETETALLLSAAGAALASPAIGLAAGAAALIVTIWREQPVSATPED